MDGWILTATMCSFAISILTGNSNPVHPFLKTSSGTWSAQGWQWRSAKQLTHCVIRWQVASCMTARRLWRFPIFLDITVPKRHRYIPRLTFRPCGNVHCLTENGGNWYDFKNAVGAVYGGTSCAWVQPENGWGLYPALSPGLCWARWWRDFVYKRICFKPYWKQTEPANQFVCISHLLCKSDLFHKKAGTRTGQTGSGSGHREILTRASPTYDIYWRQLCSV